jgi:predicted DNA-binding transcriptional regulator AlpA
MTPSTVRLLALSEVQQKTGLKHSKLYVAEADGTFPPGVRLSSRCTRWVEAEVDAAIHAMIAGATPDQLRALVRSLIEKRQTIALMVGVPRDEQPA